MDQFQVPPADGKVRFHDLQLPVEILHAVADLGFQYCMPIQAAVLPPALEGRNVAGRAQTGTGKTAAFLIAMFTTFLRSRRPPGAKPGTPRALVLAPTRELVMQIVKDAHDLGQYAPLTSVAVYGGADFDQQARALSRGPVDLLAATPGRLLDFLRRRVIDLSALEFLVIDEADRMLDMGFIPDVRSIVRHCPPKERRRSLMFSATLTEDVRRLAAQWVPDPVVVEIEPEQVTVNSVKPVVYAVPTREKFTVLYNLLRRPEMTRVLVFGNRRDRTQRLADDLQRHGIPCELLSGLVAQNRRSRTLEAFREGKVRVLVATDVAGRGLHVDDVSHVINYELPYEPEDYVHRIGRTGRAGASGVAISFACEDESFIIPEIEKYIGECLPCQQPEDELMAPVPAAARGPAPHPDAIRDPGRSGGRRPDSRGGRRSGSYGRGGRPRR